MPVRYGFRRFGEGDDFEDIDVDELLSMLADDYMESGDLDEAMDRLLREGYTTRDGQRVEGLRELLERARRRRRELESQADPDGELSRYRERLEEIEATESAEIDQLMADAEASGDERRVEVTRDVVDHKRVERELMSDRLAERLRDYQDYEFVSSEAREQFDEMMDELRRDALNTYFEQSKEFLGSPDPEELARLREMMDALSTMIEQDRRGEDLDPSFASFMERFGDYFPGAESLEDVVRMMAERAAAAEAMFNSLSSRPAERAARAVRPVDGRHVAGPVAVAPGVEPSPGDAGPGLGPRAPHARALAVVVLRGHVGRRGARRAARTRGVPQLARAPPSSCPRSTWRPCGATWATTPRATSSASSARCAGCATRGSWTARAVASR